MKTKTLAILGAIALSTSLMAMDVQPKQEFKKDHKEKFEQRMARSLDLSKEQQNKLHVIMEKAKESRLEHKKDIIAILTPEQKDKLLLQMMDRKKHYHTRKSCYNKPKNN